MRRNIILLLLISTLCSCDACITGAELTIKQQYNGRIALIYFKDKRYSYIKFDNGDSVNIDYSIHQQLLISDSLVKEFGTLEHVIYRDNKRKVILPVCKGLKLEDKRFRKIINRVTFQKNKKLP